MSRSAMLYVLSTAVAVIGMWGILLAGRQLKAPHALAGYWTPVAEAEPAAAPFTILQSGRFLKIVFGDDDRSDLRWIGERVENGTRIIDLSDNRRLSVRVEVIPATQPDEAPDYRFSFEGLRAGTWTANRDAGNDALGSRRTPVH